MNEKCSHVYSPGDGSCMVVVDHATVHASMNDLHIEATSVQNFWQFWQFWKFHYSFPVTVTSSQKGQEHYTILFNYFSSTLRILHDCTGEPVLLKQNFLKGWSFYTRQYCFVFSREVFLQFHIKPQIFNLLTFGYL